MRILTSRSCAAYMMCPRMFRARDRYRVEPTRALKHETIVQRLTVKTILRYLREEGWEVRRLGKLWGMLQDAWSAEGFVNVDAEAAGLFEARRRIEVFFRHFKAPPGEATLLAVGRVPARKFGTEKVIVASRIDSLWRVCHDVNYHQVINFQSKLLMGGVHHVDALIPAVLAALEAERQATEVCVTRYFLDTQERVFTHFSTLEVARGIEKLKTLAAELHDTARLEAELGTVPVGLAPAFPGPHCVSCPIQHSCRERRQLID